MSSKFDKSPHIIVIKNRVDLDRIRGNRESYGFPDFNETDFANRVIIVIHTGHKPSPGYGVRITNIESLEGSEGIEISISEFLTGDSVFLPEVTFPYTIVSISSEHEAALSKGVRCIDSEGHLWADKVYPD